MANETMICSKCGSENPANRLHCAACGAKLEVGIADDIKTSLKPFSVITNKCAALFLVIIIGLFISNEIFFRWAKQRGVSEFDNTNFPDSTFAMAFDSNDNLWIVGAEHTSRQADDWRYYVTELRPDGNRKTYEIRNGDQYLSLAVDS